MPALWDTAAAGWITVLGFALSISATIFAWGKWAQKTNSIKDDLVKDINNHKEYVKGQLDGIGGRVKEVESEQEHINGRLDGDNSNIQRLLGQHEALMKLIGEARGSTVQCREDTQALGEKIDRKMDTISKQLTDTTLQLSQRLAGVEKELELMRRAQ
jgi:hypothetical protein